MSSARVQGVVEEMWNGRSPACGRIMLRSDHNRPVTLVLGLIWQLLFWFVHWPWVHTELNDLYKWPATQTADRDDSAGPGLGPSRFAKRHVLTMRLHRYEHLVALLHIPIVKRVLDCVAHYCFCALFVCVPFCSQSTCSPLFTANLHLFTS